MRWVPDTVGIVLDQPHLWTDRHNPGHCDIQESPARLLLLRQQVVQHPTKTSHHHMAFKIEIIKKISNESL
jgi:hypothetical protein